MSTPVQIIAGLDIGNGYLKGKALVDGHTALIDCPSCVGYTTGSDIPVAASDAYLTDLINELDATCVSRAIPAADAGRVFFGKRAIHSGDSLREFDIADPGAKCEDALSTMLVLGSLATLAIQSVAHDGSVADTIDVEAVVGVALPIEDFMQHKDSYKALLCGDTHRAIVHNFDHDVEVSIHIADVEVLAEGAAAQYAIAALGPKFLQLALDDARAQGAPIDAAYTGELLASATNTIGIDIGEGTVNFPVFRDGVVSIESSRSIPKGWGSVLTSVVTGLRNSRHPFETRKDLADFMQIQNPMPAQAHVQELIAHRIDDASAIFVRDIIKEFSGIFRRVGMRTDAIYVYGGGAAGVQARLMSALTQAATVDDGSCLPIICLDASFSRDLNRTGLFEAATLGASSIGFSAA